MPGSAALFCSFCRVGRLKSCWWWQSHQVGRSRSELESPGGLGWNGGWTNVPSAPLCPCSSLLRSIRRLDSIRCNSIGRDLSLSLALRRSSRVEGSMGFDRLAGWLAGGSKIVCLCVCCPLPSVHTFRSQYERERRICAKDLCLLVSLVRK